MYDSVVGQVVVAYARRGSNASPSLAMVGTK